MTDKKDDDDQPLTPITTTTGSYPMLRDIAEQRATDLDELQTQEARDQAAAFRAIAAVLKSWSPTNRPTDEERKRLQDELFARNKVAATLLERHAIDSGAPPFQPSPPRRSRPPKKR